jgi:hypothetical protein
VSFDGMRRVCRRFERAFAADILYFAEANVVKGGIHESLFCLEGFQLFGCYDWVRCR